MKKPNNIDGPPQSEHLDDEIFEAMRHKGWMIPQTVEDVLRAEQELALDPPELPEALMDPMAVLRRAQCPLKLVRTQPVAVSDSIENLARAARNGTPLTPEIEEQMRRDRETVEGKDGE